VIYYSSIMVGLLLLVGSWAATPRLPPLVPGRVYGVYGRMGSGKTLLVVTWAMRHAFSSSVPIVTNFGLKVSSRVVTSWAEVYQLRDCVLILDEAHLWASSNSSKALSLEGRQFISQARKRGVCIVWVSQAPTRVAKALRELTTDLVQCRKLFGFHLVVMRDIDAPDGKPLGWSLSRVDKFAARLYSTREDVPIPVDSTY